MATVHLGIGSNQGEREINCMKAIDLLRSKGVLVTKASSLLETEPWGVTDQPRFINMAVEAETELPPEELLRLLKATEKEMGRDEGERWGPRIIDLDILFYEDRVLNAEDLRIPHPWIQARAFVLIPLSEIADEKVHPLLQKTVRQMKEELQHRGAYGENSEHKEQGKDRIR
ncbi:MAG: 2-amino-4-hydroxy-6-hydroxymethyldihydropteridine diphosphokinase [Nitrospirales bacterium]|nr:2-amino-4-hydroxy-6-hydroxymethyldihydropteridine diphosphokinase [Nitrospirales bacterium]